MKPFTPARLGNNSVRTLRTSPLPDDHLGRGRKQGAWLSKTWIFTLTSLSRGLAIAIPVKYVASEATWLKTICFWDALTSGNAAENTVPVRIPEFDSSHDPDATRDNLYVSLPDTTGS